MCAGLKSSKEKDCCTKGIYAELGRWSIAASKWVGRDQREKAGRKGRGQGRGLKEMSGRIIRPWASRAVGKVIERAEGKRSPNKIKQQLKEIL
jgi:hypothetical protein